ncbi:MAG TPA: UDP-N-acetylmuramoyl-L-alanyl-D-glutamate--2,6-diaminopimelate ligase [Alphaproteobacteria bacterium]|nr:UDP-N-acetylmuramoyl-L-alanyl-D-glutamate--2,6-diaminopimelate ligase [Alphaproteobacteria bacterium]
MNQTQTSAEPAFDLAALGELEIAGLTADSRAVQPGFLFAALPGGKKSGADFIAEAARRGAVAVLADVGTRLPADAPELALIEDRLPRLRFARMAAAFYGAQPEVVAAVTGTSGKSSTVSFARQIWKSLGFSAASLGTLGIESDPISRYGTLTTADPVALHADLAALAKAGVTRAAMEASSHGLDQYRLDGVKVRVAGFTSFGRDHLDYHPTVDDYFAAKLRLFSEVLQPGAVAVLNADIPEFTRLSQAAREAGHPVLSYGKAGRDLRIDRRTPTTTGQKVTLSLFEREVDIDFPLAGKFQLMNALCALGLAIGSELTDPKAAATDPWFGRLTRTLTTLTGVRGRLERVATLANGASIYVDYAHKPDALVAVLNALRPHTNGKLVVAFGCGGDRDPGKRPIMGEIATRMADTTIVTDDNPRSEDPATIRAAILAGAPAAIEIGDRAQAIAAGIGMLKAGDIFVIAGKGHEQGQIFGDTVRPFDDAAVARAAAEVQG